jgi:hypothetical protein
MHDAEIAIALMNQWEPQGATDGSGLPALELLHEGALGFRYLTGTLVQSPSYGQDCQCTFECLEFDDGSRAIRMSDDEHASTPWAAIAPMRSISVV